MAVEPIQARLYGPMVRSRVAVTIQDPRTSESTSFFGIIVVLEPQFAYVLVDPSFYARGYGGPVKISFPGGVDVDYQSPVIHFSGSTVGICCPNADGYDTALMRELPLCERRPGMSQCVHLFSPEYDLLTSGVVIGVEEEDTHFQHNCASDIYSACGAPVINDGGEMLGMCTAFKNQHLEAITTREIALGIEKSQLRAFNGIQQMLQHLRSYASRR